jgi:hypothetical protein
MHITFGIGNDQAEPRKGETLGFVFTCPNCQTPVSYQANEDVAVELDKDTFENFKKAMAKKLGNLENLDGAVFTGPGLATKTLVKEAINEDIYKRMLEDIRESDSFDDFLRRIGN